MKKLRQIIMLVLAILLIGGVVACGNTEPADIGSTDAGSTDTAAETNSTKSEPIVVRVGDQPTFFLLKVAEEKGFFEEEFGSDNITIEVTDFVNLGPAIVEAMAAGDIDLAIIGTLPIITANANNNKIIALASGNYSEDGFAFIATSDSGITSIEDVKGKTVAMPFGTNEHQMLMALLDKGNVSPDEVEIANMGAVDSLNAFLTGDIDAAIFKGHQIAAALEAEGVHIADNGEVGLIVNSIVGREAFIQENPEITSRFLKVLDKAQKYTIENVDEAIEIVARRTDTSIEDTTISYESRDRLVSTEPNYFLLPLTSSLEFAISQGLIDTELDITDIIDISYYESAGISE